jgi:acyl transferase domain-containing protein/acyl-CoA thioesterase FadM
MRAYVVGYRVLFHDTMAYGSHHFLTNFKFQCVAREHYYFGQIVDASDEGRAVHDNQVLLTRDAYSLNLFPVGVGERVAIVMTIEAAGERTARMCFRVVHESGQPVAAGYQTLVRVGRDDGGLLDLPDWMRRAAEEIREPVPSPGFAALLHAGKHTAIFDPGSLSLAAEALGEGRPHDGVLLGGAAPTPTLCLDAVTAAPARAGLRRVFLMPGQGSYDPARLREFASGGTTAARHIEEADAIVRATLGSSLIELLEAPSREAHDERLRAAPDLAQVGMYLLAVLTAEELAHRGFVPDAVAGHSFGEIAALVAAGVWSIADGVRVVCARCATLNELGGSGGMLAVLASEASARALIGALPKEVVSVAVVNHEEQVVLSGTFSALEAIERAARDARVETRRVLSPFPFHHGRLAPAVSALADRLGPLRRQVARVPVFSPLEGGFLDPLAMVDALPRVLATQLVTPLSWPAALHALYDAGAREFVECGGGAVLTGFVKRVFRDKADVVSFAPLARPGTLSTTLSGALAAAAPSLATTATTEAAGSPADPASRDDLEAIAIVGMGCVLPNALDPEALWKAIVTGVSGISDAGAIDPELVVDFKGGSASAPIADKTYSLLGGFIRAFEPVASAGLWGAAAAPSRVQAYLAEVLVQARGTLEVDPKRTLVAVGSTADGSEELDRALLRDALAELARDLPGSDDDRASLRAMVESVVGPAATAASLSPHAAYEAVVARVFGVEPYPLVLAVDAACASSLYAVDLGVRALRSGAVDLAFCGGTFSVGPANACLFSQFGGLSATGSRPLDEGADGVVFGDGGSMLALRRLSDAVERGERIVAVLRATGTSSDGRGPSVAVPRVEGQIKAMERAWARAGLPAATADFIEAHATATPVGDAVELRALSAVFAEGRARPLAIGSLKALTGHTGWAAGVASVIKVCKALETRTLPPQANVVGPNAELAARPDLFRVLTAAEDWPEPGYGAPRRAGVNGFGFGGSNAHLVLEEHRPGALPLRPAPEATRIRLAIVGVGSRSANGADGRLDEEARTLPAGRPVLPDVVDAMDATHFYAIRAAADALPEGWEQYRADIGVVVGLQGKTSRAIFANVRLYRDRLRRTLVGSSGAPAPAIASAFLERLDALPASGAYTLPGQMPNVAAGRVANFFDLSGPNFVVDAGEASLAHAVRIAAEHVADGSCRLMIAGAVHAPGLRGVRTQEEHAFALAVTTEAFAAAAGIEVLAVLEVGTQVPDRAPTLGVDHDVDLGAAQGAPALLEALRRARKGGDVWVAWPGLALRVAQPAAAEAPPEMTLPALMTAEPILEPSPRPVATLPPASLGRRLLVITDDPAALGPALEGSEATIVTADVDPGGPGSTKRIAIDLADDDSARASLALLDVDDFDAVVLVRVRSPKRLEDDTPLELLFVVARWAYAALESGHIKLGVLSMNAVDAQGHLDPASGSIGGFVKALARELPRAVCRALVTSGTDIRDALSELAAELALGAMPSAPEAIVRDGERFIESLRERVCLSTGGPNLVDENTVVLATGGGRGVVAVLLEALKRRFGNPLVVLGRSRPEDAPAAVVAMSDEQFDAYATEFYRQERKVTPDAPMPVLRARLETLAAAREAARTLERLRALPGAVVYRAVDLLDPPAVAEAVRSAALEVGTPGLVIHGAGVQFSGSLPQKRLEKFRQTIRTKLGGLDAVLDACCVSANAPPRVHVLGSAFSFFGNDGQHDYGAANEALHRLARFHPTWSAIAWPGWHSIGMTRGSEYVELARARGLRPLAREEGQSLFLEMMSGPAAPLIMPVSAGEVAWSGVRMHPAELGVFSRSLAAHPLVAHHLVAGEPALPATFVVELAVRALLAACPGWFVQVVEDIRFERFARLMEGAAGPFRVLGHTLYADARRRRVLVRLVSDFIHANGTILGRDVTHFRGVFEIAPDRPLLGSTGRLPWGEPASSIADPFCMPESHVSLSGPFACIHDIEVGPRGQRGIWRVPDSGALQQISTHSLPALIADAACRVAIYGEGAGREPVPVRLRRFAFEADSNDAQILDRGALVEILAAPSRREGEHTVADWAIARDRNGRTLVRLEGLVGLSSEGVRAPPRISKERAAQVLAIADAGEGV